MFPWIKDSLEALLGQGARMPNALIIHGPAGIGKRALAEVLARAILCESTGTRPCERCDSCRWFLGGNHPDLRIIEPESRQPPAADPEQEKPRGGAQRLSTEIKIEQIRGLADFLAIGSHRGRRRIAIVHPAETMNHNAANSLLKSLEEPPAAAMFLLVSDRPARLLPTIRSRCIAYSVPMPSTAQAIEWLRHQSVKEPEAWLRYAGGAPLRALELASGEAGQLVSTLRRMPDSDALRDVRWGSDRQELELLVDYLQKRAFDEALLAINLPTRYGAGNASLSADKLEQRLRVARRLGRERRALRQPLNPALFIEVCIAKVKAN